MPNRVFRNLRSGVPPGYVLGRPVGSGTGPAKLMPISQQQAYAVGSGGGGGGPAVTLTAGTDISVGTAPNYTVSLTATLGTIASQNANNVTITGGTVEGITEAQVIGAGSGSSITFEEGTISSQNFAFGLEISYGTGANNVSIFGLGRARGTSSSPAAVQSGDVLGSLQYYGYGTTKFFGSASIEGIATQTWTDTAQGSELVFGTVPNGSASLVTATTIAQDGGLVLASATGGSEGLGTLNATGLYVNGVAVSTAPITVAGGGLYSQVMSGTPTSANTGLTTWLNQGSATVNNEPTGVSLFCANTGSSSGSFHCRYKAVPSTPYTIQALVCFQPTTYTEFPSVAIGWYDGTAKLHLISLQWANTGSLMQIGVQKWTNSTTYSANDYSGSENYPNIVWLQLSDNGTTVSFAYSLDGSDYITVFSVAKSSGFLGSSGYANLFFGINAQGSDVTGTLLSWSQVPVTSSASSTSVSALLDSIGSTQGDILYRDSSVWKVLAPGSAGQVLVCQGAGANPKWAGPAVSSAVTGSFENTSSALVMLGLAGSITPTSTGTIIFTITGVIENNLSGGGLLVDLRYGTGSAPAALAAATGTAVGTIFAGSAIAAASAEGFTVTGVVTGLTVGTAYWFDAGFGNNGSTGTATIPTGCAGVAQEVP